MSDPMGMRPDPGGRGGAGPSGVAEGGNELVIDPFMARIMAGDGSGVVCILET